MKMVKQIKLNKVSYGQEDIDKQTKKIKKKYPSAEYQFSYQDDETKKIIFVFEIDNPKFKKKSILDYA